MKTRARAARKSTLARVRKSVEQGLAQLERAELIRDSSAAEAEYLFRHTLTQESAYESLLVKKRREIHHRVAEACEQLYAGRLDEFAAVLAEHYSRSGDDAKTLEYSIRAAEAAARIFAEPEALMHYTRAMDALTRLPDTEELRRRHVDVILGYINLSWGTGLADAGFVLATEAEGLAQSLQNPDGTRGDAERLARIRLMRAGWHLALCEYREAVQYVRQVLANATSLDDETTVATATAQYGIVLVLQGHFAEAEPHLVKAIRFFDETPDRWEWFSSVGALGMSLAMRGRTGEGMTLVERALERAEATDNPFGITQSRAFLSVVYFALGDMPGLLGASERAIEAAARSGHPVYSSLGLGFRALAESRSGKLADAEATLARAHEVKEKFGGKLMMADWLDAIGAEVMFNAGRTQEALTRADRAVEVAQSVGGIFAEGWARRVRGQALARLEPPRRKEADAEFAESVRLFEAGEARLEAERTRDAWGKSDEAMSGKERPAMSDEC